MYPRFPSRARPGAPQGIPVPVSLAFYWMLPFACQTCRNLFLSAGYFEYLLAALCFPQRWTFVPVNTATCWPSAGYRLSWLALTLRQFSLAPFELIDAKTC